MHNHKFRFGIRSLLLLIACFGGMFGGFHIGGRLGQSASEEQRASELVTPRVYVVGDMLAQSPSGPDFDVLIDKLTGEVEHQSWSEVGGQGMISARSTVELQRKQF